MTDTSLVALIRQRSRRLRVAPSAIRATGSLPHFPRAVIFDIYGTLLIRVGDTEKDYPRRDNRLDSMVRAHHLDMDAGELRALLHEAILRDHENARGRGVSFPEVRIEEIWQGLFPSRDFDEIRRLIVEYELAVHPCWPMPGSRRLVSSLAKGGVALGIISNAQFYTPLFLESLLGGRPEGLGFSRDLCFYSWIHGEAKPGRTMFDAAVTRLHARGIPAEHALMVGNDPVSDVAAAARTGLMTARLAAGRTFAPDATGQAAHVPPDVILARLADLLLLVL